MSRLKADFSYQPELQFKATLQPPWRKSTGRRASMVALSILHFPVPWAQDATLSFLRRATTIPALLADLGFHEVAWIDITVPMGDALRASAARMYRAASPPPSLSVVMGAASAWSPLAIPDLGACARNASGE
jgi:hypothetical protein